MGGCACINNFSSCRENNKGLHPTLCFPLPAKNSATELFFTSDRGEQELRFERKCPNSGGIWKTLGSGNTDFIPVLCTMKGNEKKILTMEKGLKIISK